MFTFEGGRCIEGRKENCPKKPLFFCGKRHDNTILKVRIYCREIELSLRRLLEKTISDTFFRRTQEGCGGLGGENPAAFPKARPIFQQPFSLPERTLAGIAFRAAGKSVRNFPAASKFARKLFQQGNSDSHSLREFSDFWLGKRNATECSATVCRDRIAVVVGPLSA